jgi:hypothetical protein
VLNKLNTRFVGITGLAIGGVSIVTAVGALFNLLSDPKYLVALTLALHDSRAHSLTDADGFVLAQLLGAFIAIIGASIVALLATYFGRPAQIPDDPKPQPPVSGNH